MKMIGSTLDYYKIEAKIGQGGMGKVYRATDTRLLRAVAIKILSLASDVDDKSSLRFLREAQAASLLNHPNICTVYDIKLDEHIKYIVMEYIDGQTLRQLREDKSSFPEEQVLDIGQQICDGLHAAHSKGILHRDIKPDNIMITMDGWVKITDFGLAKLKTSDPDFAGASIAKEPNLNVLTTSLSTLQGTASYMSPEQIRKRDIDERTDIFSLGILLYELLTGDVPFHGDDQTSVLRAILKESPVPFENSGKIVSPDMQWIVLSALEKDKAKRPRDAMALKNELQLIQTKDETPTLAKPAKLKKTKNAGLKTTIAAVVPLLILVPILFPHFFAGAFSNLQKSVSQRAHAFSGTNATITIAIAPFWGVGENALHEGQLLQRLIASRVHSMLESESNIRLFADENVGVIRSIEEAKVVGQKLGAHFVVWGEVIVLRGEVEFQSYIAISDTVWRMDDLADYLPSIDLGRQGQIRLRKSAAEDIANSVIYVAALFHGTAKEKALDLIRKITPPTYESMALDCSLLMGMKRWQQAKERIHSFFELFPDSLGNFAVLGTFYIDQKQWPQAIESYRKLLADSTHMSGGNHRLSVIYERMGQIDSAIYYAEQSNILRPNHHHYISHLGLVYAMDGQLDKAIQQYERAIKLEPRFLKHYYDLARTELLKNQYDEALDSFTRLYKKDSDYRWTLDMIGLIHTHRRQFRQAVFAYKKAIPVEADNPQHYNGLASAYMAWGKQNKAIQVLQQATALKRQDDYSRILLFLQLIRMQRIEQAKAQLDTLLVRIKNEEWPTPIIRFYAEEMPEEQVLQAAVRDHPQRDKEIKCEAYYYVGMAHLLGLKSDRKDQKKQKAMDYFKKAVATNARDFFEYELARAELDRLAH